jgi:nicotinamide mononucleotide (NMN) deamidase PncC
MKSEALHMTAFFRRSSFITLCGFSSHLLAAEPTTLTSSAQQAPTAPPSTKITKVLPGLGRALPATGLSSLAVTQYSIGTPTNEEQQYVELINRARLNPPAEGARLAALTEPSVVAAISQFGVNLTLMQTEFNAIAAAQPLAINSALTTAARGHSDWMFTNAVQSHTGAGGTDGGQRMTNAGYNWWGWGENIFSYANNVIHGHAGFEIDWGTGGTGGMQSPRGHRDNIHDPDFREIGVGIRLGTNTVAGNTVGPQLVTQNLGYDGNDTPFVTGVVYYDLNGNGSYDPGEGVGGVTVNVAGSSYYAVTASSGGYTIPVPAVNTTRNVTFTGLGFNNSTTGTIAGNKNVKVDLIPTYTPPALTGPSIAYTGSSTATYSFASINGATQYGWRYSLKSAALAEGCDNLTNATVAITASGYTGVDSSLKDSGTASWHLANPGFASQYITLSTEYYPAASASLQYRSRLGYATANQVARVQVSTDSGSTWSDLSAQAGSGGAGETVFSTKTVSLASYANTSIRLRFAYTYTSGTLYTQTTNDVGWHVDTITFTNVNRLTGTTAVEPIGSSSFSFTPPSTGTYLLSARPYYSGAYKNYGPVKEITVNTGLFEAWAAPLETAASLPAGTLANNPTGDYNKDGVSNFLAYALNLSPTTNAASLLPKAVKSGTNLQMSYTRDTTKSDISLVPQASTDLVNWFGVGAVGAPTGFTDVLDSTAGNIQTRHAAVPLSSGTKVFLRLQATRP